VLYRAKQDGPVVLVRVNLVPVFNVFEPFFRCSLFFQLVLSFVLYL
jgi:hypothetical protein